jgi:hypothetical protein
MGKRTLNEADPLIGARTAGAPAVAVTLAIAAMIGAAMFVAACTNPLRETVSQTLGAPSLLVLGSGGSQVSAGGEVSIGDASVGATRVVTFSIENTGQADLLLSSAPLVQLGPAGPFSVSAQPAESTVHVGDSLPFTLSFSPTTSGKKTATIEIASNDPTSPLFTFTVSATGKISSMGVFQGNDGIANGSGSYDFYSVEVNFNYVDVEFTIQNTNVGDLYLTGSPVVSVAMSGGKPEDITVTAQPSATIPSMQSATFTLRFTPTVQSSYEATVTIPSSDPAAPTYAFTVLGTGTNPDITVGQGATDFVSGSVIPVALGSCAVMNSRTIPFTIGNQGSGRLYLTGSPRVTIEGPDASLFSIVTQPATSPLAQGGTSSFTLRFSPTVGAGTGTKTATLVIPSNDPESSEAPFRVLVSMTATEPQIAIKVGATPVPKNGTWDFGSIPLGNPAYVTFTIENAGPGELVLQSPYLALTGGPTFYIMSWPSSPGYTIQSGATDSFQVRYYPSVLGASSATLEVYSNDPDSSPYTITLSGTATPYHGIKVLDSTGTVGMYNAAQVSGDNIYDAYYDYTDRTLKFARSSNGGATFSVARIDSTRKSGLNNSLALDGGILYLSYYLDAGIYGYVRFIKSADSGATWSMLRYIDWADGLWRGTLGTAIGASGSSVYIAYTDGASSSSCDLKIARSTDGGSNWTYGVVDAGGSGCYLPTIVVRGTTVRVAYIKDSYLWLATSTDSGSNWSLAALDSGTRVDCGISMDENAGNIYISYWAYYYGSTPAADLRFALFNTTLGTWSYSMPDSVGDTGRGSSMRYTSGKIYIAYEDFTNNDLRLAVSGNGGTSWTLSTPESAGSFGSHASIAAEGTAVQIFHIDAYNYDLRFLRSLDGGVTW